VFLLVPVSLNTQPDGNVVSGFVVPVIANVSKFSVIGVLIALMLAAGVSREAVISFLRSRCS
jgi:hypothetical protein